MDSIRDLDLGYIKGDDLCQYLSEDYLTVKNADDTNKLQRATQIARSAVQNYLAAMYNLTEEYAKDGDDRNGIVLKLVITFACWEIASGDEATKNTLKELKSEAARLITELQTRKQSLLNVTAVNIAIENAPAYFETKDRYLY